MPCRTETDDDILFDLRQKTNHLTKLLCKMVAHFGVVPGDPELAEWKEEHGEIDRRRVRREQAEREAEASREKRKELAQRAAAKLTPEELEALRGFR